MQQPSESVSVIETSSDDEKGDEYPTVYSQPKAQGMQQDCNTVPQELDNPPKRFKTEASSDTPSKKLQACKRVKREKENEPPLPQPFGLPRNYPRIVKDGIAKGCLTGRARTKFISTVAATVFYHKSYPTKDEYTHVAQQIIKNHPFMNSGRGSGHEYLVPALQDKLKYLRNYRGANEEKEKPKLEVDSSRQSTERPRKRIAPKPPTLVSSLPREDDAAVERHLKFLQKEEKKLHPNRHVVSGLMRKTFLSRRQKILEESIPLSTLLQTYPSLRHYDQIIAEFTDIMGQDMLAVFREKWETLEQKLLVIAADETDNHRIQTVLDLAGENMSDECKSITALCCLCYLLPDTRSKPDHEAIVFFAPENANVKATGKELKAPQPCVIIRGCMSNPKDAFLAAEKSVLCRISRVQELGLILLASFYVFNMHYTHGFANFFTFLECILLDQKAPKEKTRIGHLMAQLQHTM